VVLESKYWILPFYTCGSFLLARIAHPLVRVWFSASVRSHERESKRICSASFRQRRHSVYTPRASDQPSSCFWGAICSSCHGFDKTMKFAAAGCFTSERVKGSHDSWVEVVCGV